MFKVIKNDFLEHPTLEMDIASPTDDIVLFGNCYRMYKDDWKHHVHLKCTNKCDANCAFCIEHESKQDKESPLDFLASARDVVFQLKEQSHFKTLSVTGGEPTIFPHIQQIVDFANESNPLLFSINSNGAAMNAAIRENSFVLFLRKGQAKYINNIGNSKTVHYFSNIIGTKSHPCEKPVELLKYYITNSSQEGELVLDPFMGTGSCAVACTETKRNFLGIELDPHFFSVAKQRIDNTCTFPPEQGFLPL